MKEIKKEVFLTGVKPTGAAHLGNLAGAIIPAIEFTKSSPDNLFLYFIADYHSLTSTRKPEKLKQYIYEIAATWLAFGLDPEQVIFYRQSDIPEIFELYWILSCLTPKGDMNRAHAYKTLVEQAQIEGKDIDRGVNMGLYTYPVLMAADILLFNSDHVPVGRDQQQHVEIARSIAQRFNQYYGKSFTEPQVFLRDNVASIKGLDGKKMSKSYGNTIPIFSTPKRLRKLVNKIVTDSTPPGEPKNTQDSLIYDIFSAFATSKECEAFSADYQQGISWGQAKAQLYEKLEEIIAPAREKFDRLMGKPEQMDEILWMGAQKARALAQPSLEKAKKAIGIMT